MRFRNLLCSLLLVPGVLACEAPPEQAVADDEVHSSLLQSPSAPSGFRGQVWQGQGQGGQRFVGDLNGDGKKDVFMWRDSDHVWMVNLSTGSGWNATTWAGAWGSDGPINVGDLNGDGKTDVFMWRNADHAWTVNLSTGSGFQAAIWQGAWGSDGAINVGDLNGDGKADVFMSRDADHVWTVNLSTGSGFQAATWQGAWGSDGPINVGDLNGDGKTDVFMWRNAGHDWMVNLSTGAGFNAQRWTGNWGSDGTIRVGDLNGDGKTDVFMYRAAGNDWMVNLSTGTGFNAQRWLGACSSDGPTVIGDFNGDRRIDVAVWRDFGKDWLLNLSTGSGFNMQRWTGVWGSDGQILTGDLTGDGRTDVFMWRGGDWTVNVALPVLLGPARSADYGISAVEINQATQSLDNQIPLFAGKRTLVRVYADAGTCSSGPALPNLAVEATVFTLSGQPVWGPTTIGPQTVPRQVNRDNLGDTVNFELPKDGPAPGVIWSTTEAYWLRVTTNPCIDPAASPSTCARRLPGIGEQSWVPLRFYAPAVIHFRPVYSRIDDRRVTHDELMSVVKRVETMYPAARLIAHDYGDVVDGGIGWNTLGDMERQAYREDELQREQGRAPTHCGDCFYIAVNWVAPGTFTSGLANSTGTRSLENRLTTVTLNPADIDDSASTFAQELAHVLGRYHSSGHDEPDPDPSYPYADGAIGDNGHYFLLPNVVSHGRFYGADPATDPRLSPDGQWLVLAAYSPDDAQHRHDFMSYSSDFSNWVSDYTYRGVCNAIINGYADTYFWNRDMVVAGSLPTEAVCPF